MHFGKGMKNIHRHLEKEIDKECLHMLAECESLEKKLSDYKNHFSLTFRCISQDLIPVSIKSKTLQEQQRTKFEGLLKQQKNIKKEVKRSPLKHQQ